MNTKTFAQESRNLLMDGVAKKLLYWGFDTNGNVLEQPNKLSGGYTFRGEVFDDANVPQLWESLKQAVQDKGIEVVVEEAAYTWFNRMIALRIMEKNGYEQPQLENVAGMEHTPVILQKARQGQYAFLSTTEQTRLQKIIGDYTKDQEAFALLLVGYCHNHKTLNRVFGKIDDYTELLLPDNMLQDAGFLHLLNTTDAISDDDYQEVELIGWLYQFYISEKKDEVFASFKKNKKAEAKDIPAATQIFTPNWIVKYMVENTAGKIWLDKHPNSPLKSQMKYLVENDSDGKKEAIINNVEELTLIDPAAGSGHILVEGFELLYQMYMEEYYTPEEAVESILSNNLYGLDIDDRAAQLATFAILLKAAKVYPDVWQKDWLPNVYAMPEAQEFSMQEVKDFLGAEGTEYAEELEAALRLMKQAKNLGSVMKLNLSEEVRNFIEQRFIALEETEFRDFNIEAIYQNLKSYIPVLLILTKKYTSVVANPPYLGSGSMNLDLKEYVTLHYPLTKSDLFAVFMESSMEMLNSNGLLGMINQHSWMFLSSYKKFRETLLKTFSIQSLLHLGPGTFEELSGEVVQSVAFIIQKNLLAKNSNYYRYVYSKGNKEECFLKRENEYKSISADKFNEIPGYPIGYWINDNLIPYFKKKNISSFFELSNCIQPGNSEKHVFCWFEVSKNKLQKKWFKLSKGGEFRRWYGNLINVLNYENNGEKLRLESSTILRGENKYNNPGIAWTRVGAKISSFRKIEKDILCTDASPIIYDSNQSLIGFLNTKVAQDFLDLFNPTFNTQVGNVKNIPLLNFSESNSEHIQEKNIDLSKFDWDSRETSWDFEQSPLLNETKVLEQAYQNWQEQVSQDFFQLHRNEEELNRIFIEIYGLQEELTPEVELKDITILQEELNKKDMEALEDDFRANGANAIELPIDKGEVISQFISYAIGLFMGRYRLDQSGLNIAHPNPTKEELASYSYNNGQVIIDEDAILPLMGKNCNFPDDALQQINQLLDTIWGHETRTENINFIQDCLDKDLEKFLVKDFYKYHCKMYKKKPIYWLFASPKGAFQVLVYMHRMNAFTVEKIRANYLLEHIKNIRTEIKVLEGNASNLNTQEAKTLDTLRSDLIECEAYDMELKNVADQQISFDLDDGVKENYKLFESVVAKIK
jgi:hypothetical protein